MPETPAPPVERVKAEKPPPDAIPLKSKLVKKKEAEVASVPQRYRPFDQLEKNQLTTKQAPQVSNPLFSAMPGAGRVGADRTRRSVPASLDIPDKYNNWWLNIGGPAMWMPGFRPAPR